MLGRSGMRGRLQKRSAGAGKCASGERISDVNRHQRRSASKSAGLDWRANQEASRRAAQMEAAALAMTPQAARRKLAEWAARPGRSQAEVNAMNARAGNEPA